MRVFLKKEKKKKKKNIFRPREGSNQLAKPALVPQVLSVLNLVIVAACKSLNRGTLYSFLPYIGNEL